jgi:hypothetical protein
MKNIILLVLLTVVSSVYSNVLGQTNVPAVPDNANIQDNDIKMRSVEMERVKRDAAKTEASKFAPVNSKIEVKFPEIKEDFEGMQIAQAAIIKAYSTGSAIDYATIASSADEIVKKAERLDANLFAEATTDQRKDETKPKEEKPKALRDLIVELDETIGSFVSSKIFVNLKAIEPEEAIRTRADLLKIQRLSERLAEEAKKNR